MKGQSLSEHGFLLQSAAFGWWPGVERQRGKSKAVGTGRTKLPCVCRNNGVAPAACPGQVSPGSGEVGREKVPKEGGGGRPQPAGCTAVPGHFPGSGWDGQVGIGLNAKSSNDRSWESLGEVGTKASAEGVAHLSNNRAEASAVEIREPTGAGIELPDCRNWIITLK